eukprot:GAHX01000506.1.p3 GENE.GAHX01000506.1~~GAHX01000506.1.p3  ORF type:complete len:54 (-),score=7.86 GAHX01000506.1:128-289(-)
MHDRESVVYTPGYMGIELDNPYYNTILKEVFIVYSSYTNFGYNTHKRVTENFL